MTWNRAKYFEVFGLGCSGLGNFRFSSVVPRNFAIHITFQVLCLLAILLLFACGIHMTWKVICMSRLAYNLYVNIILGSFRFGGAADLERLMFVLCGFLQTTSSFSLIPALKNIKPGTKTCTYLNRASLALEEPTTSQINFFTYCTNYFPSPLHAKQKTSKYFTGFQVICL